MAFKISQSFQKRSQGQQDDDKAQGIPILKEYFELTFTESFGERSESSLSNWCLTVTHHLAI